MEFQIKALLNRKNKFSLLLLILISCLPFTKTSSDLNFADDIEYTNYLKSLASQINNSQNNIWTAELSPRFKNMTKEQIKGLMGTFLINKIPLPQKKTNFKVKKSPPPTFDSRQKWPNCSSISQIRDQANCGSCWAVAATSVMSDRLCIEKNEQALISSLDLFTCCRRCGYGCGGGYPADAWKFLLETGIVSGGPFGDKKSCRPYPFFPCNHKGESSTYPPCPPKEDTPGCFRQCQNGDFEDYMADKRKAAGFYKISKEKMMEKEIFENGPIQCAMAVYEDFLLYKNGIYVHGAGKVIGGHSIKIIGWGEENGIKYWNVANSWNEFWGEEGYFRILKGEDHCSIEFNCVAGNWK